jgi:Tol biopolymer transport system component
MALSETKLGPYDIVGPLGAGGMGEVYRATDTRLKRQVAIKILPAPLAADPDRLARFQREAEVLASLSHPHIAGIYGLEESNGVKALVMELVEGPTLADRIRQGPIPLDEALPIAQQIAAALEAAHEQAIIHRDLKPANIKVREDGTVKVLDFGLAKLADPTGIGRGGSGRHESSDAPTMTSPAAMTGMGIILGTAAYMSPEQARGRMVDKRTDVWAFGAVLYEMLTGARAFEGDDIAETIASVIKGTPNWAALPADVPPQVVTLIQRCLDKDRNARVGDIAVARFLLSDHTTSSIGPMPAGASTPSGAHASGATGASVATSTHVAGGRVRPGRERGRRGPITRWLFVAGGLGLALFFATRQPTVVGTPVTRLQMGVSPAETLPFSNASVRPSRTAITLSPDGRTVVFAGVRGADSQLYLRALDHVDAIPIPGTEGAIAPFFSPDGGSIAFWAGTTLKRVPIAGGAPATICETATSGGWGASWGEDDTIYFSDRTGILKVSAAGGTPAQVTRDAGSGDSGARERHLLPQAMSRDRMLLFTTALNNEGWDSANIVARSLDTGEQRVLIPQATDARYVKTGHLVFLRSGTLMAVPFDVKARQVTGSPVALIDNVMQSINAPNGLDETGAGQFAISASGTLLYVVGGITPNLMRSMVWVDRSGATPPVPLGVAGPYLYPRVAPDGRRIAVEAKRGTSRGSTDLWIYDALRGAPQRVTFNGSTAPVWSPDSKRLVHQVDGLAVINADGSGGQGERLPIADSGPPSSWSAAANAIAYLQYYSTAAGRFSRIWIVPMSGDHTPRVFLESTFRLSHAEFSPDGRWIAYVSSESGTNEVYVQPYPGPGEKIRISTAGGFEPLWTRNGKELLYRNGRTSEEFYAVPIRALSPFQADAPRLLFKAKPGEYDSTTPTRSWDVSADGQRFFLLRAVENNDKPVTSINVVLNWTEELKRLVSPK